MQFCPIQANTCVRSFPSLPSKDLAGAPGAAVPLSHTVKTLWGSPGQVNTKLTFRLPIINLCKSCFYHIRAMRQSRSALTKNMSQTIVHLSPLALIMLYFDFCRSFWS